MSIVLSIFSNGTAVLILCDLYGSTPYNVALTLSRGLPQVKCLAGVNLALLLEAMLTREPLDDVLLAKLLVVGQSGVIIPVPQALP